ncbi:MAG: zinc ribbon domain-containing protein [Steroidobacteraceae bacterium]
MSGPSGLRQLVVRQWECSACGAEHDRDVNAARNILTAGLRC